jgi:hypothetical protein
LGRPCTICTLPNRAEIDAKLVTGAFVTSIATRYGVSGRSLYRHRAAHLERPLLEAASVALDLGTRAFEIADDLRRTRRTAQLSGNHLAATRAAMAEIKALEVLGDRLGLEDAGTLDLLDSALKALQVIAKAALTDAHLFDLLDAHPETVEITRRIREIRAIEGNQ